MLASQICRTCIKTASFRRFGHLLHCINLGSGGEILRFGGGYSAELQNTKIGLIIQRKGEPIATLIIQIAPREINIHFFRSLILHAVTNGDFPCHKPEILRPCAYHRLKQGICAIHLTEGLNV